VRPGVCRPGRVAAPRAGLEQDVDAQYVRPQEVDRLQYGAIYVRLGGEVDDGVDLGHERAHGGRIGNVADDEPQPGRLLGVRLDGARLARLPA